MFLERLPLGNIMKQTLGILLIILFFGCTNGKNNNTTNTDFQQTDKFFEQKIEYEPIFINLSPNMSDFQFEQELKRSTPNKKFTISLNNYKFDFDITKYSNRIVLDYNDIKTLIFTPKFGEDAEKRYMDFINKEPIEQNEILIKKFINLFKNKYPKQIEQLPLSKNQIGEYYNNQKGNFTERNLLNYKFKKENYLIFQDSIKTVIIGYTNAEYPRKLDKKDLELITYTSQISESISRNSMESVENIRNYFKEYGKLSPYNQALKLTGFEEQISRKKGLSLEINYMHNLDFEFLTNMIYKANNEFNDKLKQEDSLRKIKQKKENSNLNKI